MNEKEATLSLILEGTKFNGRTKALYTYFGAKDRSRPSPKIYGYMQGFRAAGVPEEEVLPRALAFHNIAVNGGALPGLESGCNGSHGRNSNTATARRQVAEWGYELADFQAIAAAQQPAAVARWADAIARIDRGMTGQMVTLVPGFDS